MKHSRIRQQGSALLIVMLVMAMMGIIGFAALEAVRRFLKERSATRRGSRRAFRPTKWIRVPVPHPRTSEWARFPA